MRKLIKELRMYISELLLHLAFRIAPKTKEGILLKTYIGEYAVKLNKCFKEQQRQIN